MKIEVKKAEAVEKTLTDRTPTSLSAYRAQRNWVRGLILRTRRDFEADPLIRAKVNPKLFNNYLRRSTKNKDPIPLLRTAEERDLIENEAKADHLSDFSRSVFTKETAYDYPADVNDVDTIFETVQFPEAVVLKELLGLKESKSPSPHEASFSAFNDDGFAKVFGTFVRPQLESAIQAWRPWAAKDINILEKV
ncbi:unnamed protein product [Dibothriocephalus latus]|uniref:Uncharacterized protein n=1 Tax=Dibothriocephalus latus TaxID=60516 RepID=A0A3P7P4N9_DIBLA|nr:unnamed protein product [Dibothriocephalus latus]